MGTKRDDTGCRRPQAYRQAEFIRHLCSLAEEGSTRDLQEAALTFWQVYPKISLTFARRLIGALQRLDVPAQRFDPSLLAILARCYLSCGQMEQACEYLVAARRIVPVDASYALISLIGELEVNVCLARSQLEVAQSAYQRLKCSSQQACGDLTSEQLLLGVRLSFAKGDLSQAARRAIHAAQRACDDEQRCRAQLAALKIDEYLDGDIKRELVQLVALEHFQRMRSHGPLSTETRAQLFCRLSFAFLNQGKFNQAALRLRKTDAQATWPFDAPELAAAALALVDGYPEKARRHLQLLDCRRAVGLSQAEYLERRFWALLMAQALDGAEQGLDEAEEFFRLCEATTHLPLRQRACLLFASSLIAAGSFEQARCLLQENGLEAVRHKGLRLMQGCLFALCNAGIEASDAQSPGSSLGYLADLLSDEDMVATILILVRIHPELIKLLVIQGLDQAFSSPVRHLLDSRLAVMQRFCRERLPAHRSVSMGQLSEPVGRSDSADISELPPGCSLQHAGVSYGSMLANEPCPGFGHVLQFQLFGSLQVRRQGVCLDLEHLRRSKVRDLIVALALAHGREVSRNVIIEELWPQQDCSRSLNSFYVVWNALKGVFLRDEPRLPARLCSPEQFPFSNTGGRCSLLTDYCDLDLNKFDRLAQSIKEAAFQGKGEHCFRFADELIVVYHDEVLPADLDNDQLDHTRLHYQKTFVEVMLLAARMALARRRSGIALPFIERGLAADHSCEELYRLAMHAYALEGRRDDSLRSYYRCRKNLAHELGIEPSAQLSELFAQLVSSSYPASNKMATSPRFLTSVRSLERPVPGV